MCIGLYLKGYIEFELLTLFLLFWKIVQLIERGKPFSRTVTATVPIHFVDEQSILILFNEYVCVKYGPMFSLKIQMCIKFLATVVKKIYLKNGRFCLVVWMIPVWAHVCTCVANAKLWGYLCLTDMPGLFFMKILCIFFFKKVNYIKDVTFIARLQALQNRLVSLFTQQLLWLLYNH